MKKVVIGISSNMMANFDGWFTEHYLTYCKSEAIDVVLNVEAIPIVLPVTDDINVIKSYLEMIDGLILTGGHDVYPLLYDDNMDIKCGNLYKKTDFFDINLIKMALENKIPTISICRGVQITNVAFQGTLYQDIFSAINTRINHHAPVEGNMKVHAINILNNNSIFSKLTGLKDRIYVNSIHHQAIKDISDRFEIVAQADDGVIEIIELKEKDQFFIGTQFHPEILGSLGDNTMMKLFEGMVHFINLNKEKNDE